MIIAEKLFVSSGSIGRVQLFVDATESVHVVFFRLVSYLKLSDCEVKRRLLFAFLDLNQEALLGRPLLVIQKKEDEVDFFFAP